MDIVPLFPAETLPLFPAETPQSQQGPEPVIDPIFLRDVKSPKFPDRKKFACCDDIAILRTVNQIKPWQAAHGKTMAAWTSIAELLSQDSSFIKGKRDGD